VIPELIADAGVVAPAGDVAGLAAAFERLSDNTTRRALAQAAEQERSASIRMMR